MNQIAIPEGFRLDAQKRLVHESLIKPIDQARDQLVLELVEKAKQLHSLIAEFRCRRSVTSPLSWSCPPISTASS